MFRLLSIAWILRCPDVFKDSRTQCHLPTVSQSQPFVYMSRRRKCKAQWMQYTINNLHDGKEKLNLAAKGFLCARPLDPHRDPKLSVTMETSNSVFAGRKRAQTVVRSIMS